MHQRQSQKHRAAGDLRSVACMVLAFVQLTVDEISESCVSCSHDQAVQAAADAGAVSISHQCGSNIVHTSRCATAVQRVSHTLYDARQHSDGQCRGCGQHTGEDDHVQLHNRGDSCKLGSPTLRHTVASRQCAPQLTFTPAFAPLPLSIVLCRRRRPRCAG